MVDQKRRRHKVIREIKIGELASDHRRWGRIENIMVERIGHLIQLQIIGQHEFLYSYE